MRFVQVETLPEGRALVGVDKVTRAVPQDGGTPLFLGAQTLDVSHLLDELENVLAGCERKDVIDLAIKAGMKHGLVPELVNAVADRNAYTLSVSPLNVRKANARPTTTTRP